MKRSKRKQEIYAASAKLFRNKGYAATSVRDIAEQVGIEPSSLYSHIKSKEEILTNICADCAILFAEGMEGVLSTDGPNAEKLEALVDLHIDIAIHHPSSVTVFNDEWKHLPEKELKSFLAKRKKYEDAFKELLIEGIAQGDIEPITASTALNIIIHSVKWLHFYTKRRTPEQLEIKRQEIKNFINKGLKSIR